MRTALGKRLTHTSRGVRKTYGMPTTNRNNPAFRAWTPVSRHRGEKSNRFTRIRYPPETISAIILNTENPPLGTPPAAKVNAAASARFDHDRGAGTAAGPLGAIGG